MECQEYFPKYQKVVKVSGWQTHYLAEPYDNLVSKTTDSHYKTFGRTDQFYNSTAMTTKEILEDRINYLPEIESVKRSLTNFSTHPLIRAIRKEKEITPKGVCNRKITSTTQRAFRNYETYLKRDTKQKQQEQQQDSNENLHQNKILKSEFTSLSSTPFKFMDDHFHQISPERQCLNLLKRQRFISFIPWLGIYQEIK